jgi:hypothetical protein
MKPGTTPVDLHRIPDATLDEHEHGYRECTEEDCPRSLCRI